MTRKWIAKGARKCEVLIAINELITEEHDLPLQQGGTDLGSHFHLNGLCQINTEYLCAGVARHRTDIESEFRRVRRALPHESPLIDKANVRAT
jgi:hypothetical protein